MTVYVITRWIWGGGGDDRTEIIGVAATQATADKIRAEADANRPPGYDDADVTEMAVQP